MIHINLLPVRTSKKQEAGRQQLILLGVVLVGALLGNSWWLSKRSSVADAMQRQVAATQKEIAQLDKVIGEVKDITQRKKELEDKLAVLDKLKKNRSGPVKVLDAVQNALPKKVWLQDMAERGGAMSIKGSALSHDDLAEFMRSLENVVDTPKGIGRVVEGGEAGKVSRVELAVDGTVEEFPVGDVHPFFTNVQLTKAQEQGDKDLKVVDFELSCTASYSA